MTSTLPIALTLGEPAGIGLEITLKAWVKRETRALPLFYLLGDLDWLAHLAKRLGMEVPLKAVESGADAVAVWPEALPVYPVPLVGEVSLGAPSVSTAQAVMRSIELGVEAVSGGQAAALVTNPIQKNTLYEAGFDFPGHTEYLGALCGGEAKPLMILSHEELRVVPVTSHLSLRDAIEALDQDLIVDVTRRAHAAMRQDFGFLSPRIVVAGLNPHAGENGALGREEIEIISPAIETLRKEGLDVRGPYPCDTLFHAAARREYDLAVTMYHDQALLPLKTIDFDAGVNSTHGLPIVRTSPDHGTALGLAGTGQASSASLEASLHLARFIAERRGQTA